MSSLFLKPLEQEFQDRQRNLKFKKGANLRLALEARVARGFEASTGKVIGDLLSKNLEDPEADDIEKISVAELQMKYPDAYWTEPLTDRQALRKLKTTQFRNSVQQTIDDREQGITGTVVGFTAELATASLFSPETYVAPFVGRLATSTASRMFLQSTGVGKVGNVFQTLTKSSALTSKNLVKKAEALRKQKFLAGATEDLIITGAISEPLYQSREEMLGNPQGVSDYFTTVLTTAAFSGVANSVLGRFVDSKTMANHLDHRSRELANMVTGQEVDLVDPVYRRMAKTESDLAEGFDDANFPSEFEGRVRIYHNKESSFVSAFDETTGDIIINAANVSDRKKFKTALENLETVASLKNGKFNFRSTKGRVVLQEPPEIEVIDLPSTQLNSDGISLIDPSAPKRKPASVVDEKAPATEYDPAKAPEAYTQQLSDLEEELATFDINPAVDSRSTINSELPEGVNVPEDVLGVPENSKLFDDIADNEALDILEETRTRSFNDLKSIGEIFDNIGDNSENAFKFFNLENKDLTPEQLGLRRFLIEAGFTADDFIGAKRLEFSSKVKKQLNDAVFIETRREFLSRKATREWGGFSDAGKHAEVHAQLDGSLVAGGKYFDGQGNNVYGLIETYRNRYAHTLRGALSRHGVEQFFDKYDNNAKDFWVQVSRALDAADNSTNLDIKAREVGNTLKVILESQRRHLNRHGAGINKLEGFLFTTVHNRQVIVNNQSAWNKFFIDDDNIDWDRTIGPGSTAKQKQDFVDSFYKDIDEGFLNDVEVDTDVYGGRKGEAFAKSRKIHFKPGKQVSYNDSFGNANTAQTVMDQIELRAKAMAITERLGPDYKRTWKSISENLKTDSVKDIIKLKQLKAHYDEITGEANVVENQDVASLSNKVTNVISATVNQGSGVTIGVSDLASQFVALYSSGLAPSMGRAVRYVKDSYIPALRSLVRGNDDRATSALKETIIPYASNIEAVRKLLGDTSVKRQGNLAERLNLNVIKYSGAGFFTKLSQLTSTIGTQRALADIVKSGKFTDDFVNTLGRYNITTKEFLKLADDPDIFIGNQLSVFHIKDKNLKRKFQNLLGEQMRLGSLMADPKQASHVKMGLRPGSFLGTAVRQVGLFMPSALAMHQKVLMRLAIMSNGDARFMELMKRGRRVEMAVITGILLGSATAVVSIKDLINNREPFWAGDKPLDPAHMLRVLKVSGVVPLITEAKDIATGGMAGQAIGAVTEFAKTAAEGSFVDVLAESKNISPVPWTNFGAGYDALMGTISDEYLRDTLRRDLMFKKYTGQGRLFD